MIIHRTEGGGITIHLERFGWIQLIVNCDDWVNYSRVFLKVEPIQPLLYWFYEYVRTPGEKS